MLKRVSIQNFKSLKDVTLDLQKVNLLIGPNNSGKSNFLKALKFYYNSAKYGLNVKDELCLFKNPLNSVNVELTFEQINYVDYEYVSYTIHSLATIGERFVGNHNYQFAINTSNTLKDKGFRFNTGTIDNIKSLTFDDLNNLGFNGTIYKPDPNEMTIPGAVGIGEEFVNADASNVVGFLDLILGKYRRSHFQKIESDLNKCLPEFNEINLEDSRAPGNIDKNLKGKSFKRLGLSNAERGITYWANELSEGTLYFLAILCIINQPNPPKLLLIEEPEKGIHPRRIEEVINLIFNLVEEKDIQVIMTTHSPIVVDMFKDMPESVFIFDKDDEGATYVKNLQKNIIEPETAESEKTGFDPPHYLNGLGQAWKVGLIGGVPR